MATIKQQAIDDIQLQHQSEKPERPWPDVTVGLVIEIVYHEQLPNDLTYIIMPRASGHGIDYGEADEPHYHHLEQLEIMIAHERHHAHAPRIGSLALAVAVFHLQAVSAEKEKHWHTVVAKERDDMGWEKLVDTGCALCEPVDIVLEILVLVFLHYRVEPVAEVVKKDSEDGQSTQGVAFSPREQPSATRNRCIFFASYAYLRHFPCLLSFSRAASLSLS